MENNNGRGIFYGVIGVATLVIAIIGATFAFFAASQTGNTITAEAAKVGLTFTDSKDQYMKTHLIPVETGFADSGQSLAAGAATAFAESTYVGAGKCVDKAGYDICSIYEFTVTNTGSANLPISVSIQTSNTIANLKFAVFAGKATTIDNWYVNPDADHTVTSAGTALATQTGELVIGATAIPTGAGASASFDKKLDVILTPASESTITDAVTYSVMVWIEEIGVEQSSDGEFTGTVTVTTADGQGITGTLA